MRNWLPLYVDEGPYSIISKNVDVVNISYNSTLTWNDCYTLVFLNSSLTAYNFIFLPIVVLFWLYFSLTRTSNFVNFFNLNANNQINNLLKVKVESFSSFFKYFFLGRLSKFLYKTYLLFLLSI